jgi:hypothetical protein
MGFFGRLSNGWSLAMESMGIVWRNKKLMIFPIISSIALILLLGSFAGGLWAGGVFDTLFEDDSTTMDGAPASAAAESNASDDVLFYTILFGFYFLAYFTIVFFNMALIHCANHAFNNADFTLGTGIAFSFSRIGAIIAWALVSATVGLILRIIEDKSDKVAAIIAGILGMVWSLLTFFVVPVIAYENVGPIAAIKRSGELFKRTWGERVGAHFAFGWIGFLTILLIALPVGLLLGLLDPLAGIIAGVLCALIIGLLTTTAETVFKAAVYQYAIGRPAGSVSEDRLARCFGPK